MKKLTRLSFLPSLLLVSLACSGKTSETERDDTASGGSSDSGTGGSESGSGGSQAPSAGGTSSTGGSDADGGSLSTGGALGGAGAEGQATGGGPDSGGSGGDGSGGADGTGAADGSGGDGGGCGTFRKAPRNARSASFSGDDDDYSALYELPCTDDPDCAAPCETLGGSEWFCDAHVCIDSEPDYCLPPTKWRALTQVLIPTGQTSGSAVTSLGTTNGAMQDRLIVEDFSFDIPDDATILGIEVDVVRAKEGASTNVVDYAVQIVKAGEEVGSNYGTTDLWADTMETVTYGGADDLWGESWTPQDINDGAFGVAIGALPNGGGRAYVDIVYVTVHTDCP